MQFMRLSAHFTLGTYSGKEWPPAPMRLFQAIVAGAGSFYSDNGLLPDNVQDSLKWFECLRNPVIFSEKNNDVYGLDNFVPNNDDDQTMRDYLLGKDTQEVIASRRKRYAKKSIQKRYVNNPVHYYWEIDSDKEANRLIALAGHVSCLGRGIDSAWLEGCIEDDLTKFSLPVWKPAFGQPTTSQPLFVPVMGSLGSLIDREKQRRSRMQARQFVDPPIVFERVHYDCSEHKTDRPYRLYDIRKLDGRAFHPWKQENLIVVTAMVRHQLEILHKGKALNGFVTGHSENQDWRLSWIPLPSTGHHYADGMVRRMMILGPQGADRQLMTRALHGMQFAELKPVDSGTPVALIHESETMDGAVSPYFKISDSWHTITPVLLPGYTTRGHDQKGKLVPRKLETLVQKALLKSGLPEAVDIMIQKAPFHKNGAKAGDFQTPRHLNRYPQYHLRLKFQSAIKGPVIAGAGRHYGLGLFAADEQNY